MTDWRWRNRSHGFENIIVWFFRFFPLSFWNNLVRCHILCSYMRYMRFMRFRMKYIHVLSSGYIITQLFRMHWTVWIFCRNRRKSFTNYCNSICNRRTWALARLWLFSKFDFTFYSSIYKMNIQKLIETKSFYKNIGCWNWLKAVAT